MKWLLPPVLWLLCLIATIGFGLLSETYPLLPDPFHWVGLVPLVAGITITFGASRQFRRVETNIHTFRDPGKLVTKGLFARSRNPMYLGFALALAGVVLLVNDVVGLIFLAVFILAAQCWYIPFEERRAKARFGNTYDEYRARVRRWI